MSKLTRRLALGAITAIAAAATGFQFQRWFTEQPKYNVLKTVGGLEVRQYETRIVATTLLSAGETKSDGFRILAGYIFGGNAEGESIAMTSPVVSQPDTNAQAATSGERISMTSPVETEIIGEQERMQFVMPSEYSLTDLPVPTDPRVEIREIPGQVVAVLQFSGRPSEAEFAAKTEEALRLAREVQFSVVGLPRIAQYDPPWTLGWIRRNEVLLPIEHSTAEH